MTTVAFHFNVPDRLVYTCRLLRKAIAGRARLIVTGSADTLKLLDQDLWAFSATGFLPHCGNDANTMVLRRSPVLLVESIWGVPHHGILVNLGDLIPEGFQQFDRVIEVVGKDVDERHAARLRWKQYLNSGFDLIRHDFDQKAIV